MNTLLRLVIVLAVAHLLALAGFVVWLFASGRIDGERLSRVRDIFAVPIAKERSMRADDESRLASAATEASEMQRLRELPFASAERSDKGSRSTDRIDLGLRAFEDKTRRLREELRKDGATLEQRIQAFEQRQKEWENSIAADKRRVTDEQFRKAVKSLESLPPKQARDLILELVNSSRMDTAVAYLDAMSSSKASNLLKSFKGDEETKVAAELLERLRMLGLESEARAERNNGAKPADTPADPARPAPARTADGSGAASNRALEVP